MPSSLAEARQANIESMVSILNRASLARVINAVGAAGSAQTTPPDVVLTTPWMLCHNTVHCCSVGVTTFVNHAEGEESQSFRDKQGAQKQGCFYMLAVIRAA